VRRPADVKSPQVYGHGLEDEFPDGPPTVVIRDLGCLLVLRFAPGDIEGAGPLQELRVLPDTEPLEPRSLRQFAPQSDIYVATARAAMRILGPKKYGTAQERWENYRSALDALRKVGRAGRGLSDEFYSGIAKNYRALVEEGEPHPVKSLAEIHHVTISAASRWIKEARRRGFLPADTKRKRGDHA
jgi:hypothetical protein